MGRAQAGLGNFEAVMGRRRGARREFPVLDDDLVRRLQRVGTYEASSEDSWETLDEAQRRLDGARRDGDVGDERIAVIAIALAEAVVGNIANKIELSAIDYAGMIFSRQLPPEEVELALRAAEESLAQQLGERGMPVNAGALLERAAIELRAAAAVLQARSILADEERVLKTLLGRPGADYGTLTKDKGKLEGRFSEDDWADVLMSCYRGFDSDSDITMEDAYLAALTREHEFGATTSHPTPGTQRMLEEMYQEAQVVRDRVRSFLA